MPLSALALVLAAALLHATWNIVAKHAGGDDRFALIGTLQHVVIWAPVGLWAGWNVLPQWGVYEWALVAASAVVHVAYFSTLLRGYRRSDLTVVYPVARGTGPLLSAGGAMLLLGERPGLVGAAGIVAIGVGVFMIAGGPGLWARAHNTTHDPAQRRRVRAGLAYGGATGVLIAGYTLLFAALIGGRLLGEADRGLRMAGAASMALGVIALSWA